MGDIINGIPYCGMLPAWVKADTKIDNKSTLKVFSPFLKPIDFYNRSPGVVKKIAPKGQIHDR
jgi:hypothetical protein